MRTIGTAILILRPAILFVGVLAQAYLFVEVRRALQASGWSRRFRSRATWCAATIIGGLGAFNAYVVLTRLPWVEPPLIAQVGLLYPAVVWSYGAVGAALILLGLRAAGRLGPLVARGRRRSAGAGPPAPGAMDRRRMLQTAAGGLASLPFVLAGYGAGYATKAYRVTELSLRFGRSLRVVHLSDIHAGLYMTRDEMQRYADLANALQPDLFVLTGDFISNSMYFLYGCAEEMARVRSRYGTFAVLGNHEHWYGSPREVAAVFRDHQISLLNNAHRMIQTDQGPFAVAGIDDLGNGHADLGAALQGRDPSTPTLLLSHQPEIFPLAAQHGIPLTLSGHWHGGQIRLSLPGLELSLAHLLSPYPEGLYRLDASHLYVTRGIGTAWAPIRLNASPEVTLLHLT
jgi:predicted MPP superfamily phosphohydrolase